MSNNPQTPDQADLRARIAQAIRDAACSGGCDKTEEECAKERIQPFVWHHGRLAVVEGSPEMIADAVLTALPAVPVPPTTHAADRAAVLLWAADQIDAETRQAKADRVLEPDKFRPCRDASAQLRRMADEAQQPAECSPACSEQHTYSPGCALALVEAQQQPEMRPARGDRFEAWLKAQRDLYDRTDEREESSEFWHEFDRALDEYRLHADTGTPLSEPVSGPGRVADEDPAETDPRPCGDQLTEWTCTLRSGRHDGWQHHDEIEGVWWDQCRVEPYSNRDQLAAEAPQ